MVVQIDEKSGAQIERTELDWYELVMGQRKQIQETKTQLGNLTLMAEHESLAEKLNTLRKSLNSAELELEKFEPILKENPQRFVIFPIMYKKVWAEYKKAMASFWTAEEIVLTDDIEQWRQKPKTNGNESKLSLSDNDRFFIKHILAFFASADGIVNENLAQRFYSEVQLPEARCFYGFQIMMENIHGEVYSLLIDSLVEDENEKTQLLESIKHFPAIKKLADWAMKWLNSDRPFNQRLIAFACVEGILFSGPFCAIFWLKKRGLLPGLTFSNELISRDENLHMIFACLLNSMLVHPATDEMISEIISSAVELQKEFINESLPCNLIGMNAVEMSKYIEYVGDHLAFLMGSHSIYGTGNPFEWMDLISAQNKTNFFEKKVGEYNKAKFNQDVLQTDKKIEKNTSITLLDDF